VSEAELPDRVRAFLAPPRFATIATTNPDGGPHQAVVWYVVRGNHLVVNSMAGRRWPSNLRRDPRFSLLVEDGLDYVSLAGTAVEVADPAAGQADIAELARRYEAPDEAERLIARRFRTQHRISFQLWPERIHEHWDG
jgi:PPOX class probable F420-dependent enzyme